jgi:three-Cys-motif partner protein
MAMPKTKGAGFSDDTREKQEHLRAILEQHIAITRLQDHWRAHAYYYIDITAGPGYYPKHECEGSPLVFLKTIEKFGLDYRAFMIENSPQELFELRCNLADYNCTILGEDNKVAVPRIINQMPRNTFGVLYCDPNGIPDFGLLEWVSKRPSAQVLDILIRYNAAAVKRNLHNGYQRLLDSLDPIKKNHWIIQEPSAKWQWSFLWGLQTPNVHVMKKLGFHYLGSKRGKEIATKLHHTKNELQMELF